MQLHGDVHVHQMNSYCSLTLYIVSALCLDRHFHTCAVERLAAVSGIPFHTLVGNSERLRGRFQHPVLSSPSHVSRLWLHQLQPSNWKAVFNGLEALGLEELSQEIKEYLTSILYVHACMHVFL